MSGGAVKYVSIETTSRSALKEPDRRGRRPLRLHDRRDVRARALVRRRRRGRSCRCSALDALVGRPLTAAARPSRVARAAGPGCDGPVARVVSLTKAGATGSGCRGALRAAALAGAEGSSRRTAPEAVNGFESSASRGRACGRVEKRHWSANVAPARDKSARRAHRLCYLGSLDHLHQ